MFSRGSNPESTPANSQGQPQQVSKPQVREPVPVVADRQSPASASPRVSTIGPDLKIVGNLVCKGELHIEGRVEGNIDSRIISVKQGAQIDGSLAAETILVDGAVIGQIKAPTVTVARSARVLGDVLHQTLAVEAGAHLEGHCRQIDAAPSNKGQLRAAGNRKGG